DFLDLLYGRNPAIQGKPLASFRGVLDWPLRGRVVRGFGVQLDPRYGTKVPHNGIDIAPAEPGDEVRAIYPGKVLFAAPFPGYGVTVVVHHAGRAFTLYGGLASARVAKDDVVSLGAPVGSAGDLVYFEIRVENHPEDPLTWLREAPQ
ncbi:MAG: murein hydrolase activator EnvC family protein, partial [Acidobacteriota bacterium]